MNEVAPIQQPQQFIGSSALTIELAKMLALVAPITMTVEQQELWLRAAADALEGIRTDEVEHVSAEVRRSVTRPSQIVPEISKLVAENRARASRMRAIPSTPLPMPAPRLPAPPMTEEEIARLPKWLKGIGLRSGLLVEHDGKLVER